MHIFFFRTEIHSLNRFTFRIRNRIKRFECKDTDPDPWGVRKVLGSTSLVEDHDGDDEEDGLHNGRIPVHSTFPCDLFFFRKISCRFIKISGNFVKFGLSDFVFYFK